ncbi:hypothetical protein N9Z49_00540 [Akkermansiaceae bacterium]|nr:hypothetical protein [Akkermansiaceae bacterium]
MKAFVFNPTDKNIGKFKLKSLNEIEAATKDFIQKSGDVPDFSYIQVGLDTWTIGRRQRKWSMLSERIW